MQASPVILIFFILVFVVLFLVYVVFHAQRIMGGIILPAVILNLIALLIAVSLGSLYSMSAAYFRGSQEQSDYLTEFKAVLERTDSFEAAVTEMDHAVDSGIFFQQTDQAVRLAYILAPSALILGILILAGLFMRHREKRCCTKLSIFLLLGGIAVFNWGVYQGTVIGVVKPYLSIVRDSFKQWHTELKPDRPARTNAQVIDCVLRNPRSSELRKNPFQPLINTLNAPPDKANTADGEDKK